MAEIDDRVFEAMNGAVSRNDNDPLLDFDKTMKDQGLDRGEINRLYQRKYPDVPRNPDRQRHFDTKVKPYWDAETYRTLNPEDREARLLKAQTIKGDYMEHSEKKRFTKLTGMNADQFEWDNDMYTEIEEDGMITQQSPFRTKGGFEDWMRDKGYYDETKTGGIMAAIQRILPGGKKGMSRRFADPKEDRKIHRAIKDNMFLKDEDRVDVGDFQKTGDY